MDVTVTPTPAAPMASPAVSERSQARRETFRLLIRRPAFIIGNIIVIGWILTAILGERITPYDPFNYFTTGHLPPSPEHLDGHGPAWPRRAVAGHGRLEGRPRSSPRWRP